MSVIKIYDGSSWVEIAKKSDIPSLSGYATQTWCNNNLLKLTGVTDATGKAKVNVLTTLVGKKTIGEGYLELSDSSATNGVTTYYRDRIVYGTKTLNLPTPSGASATLGLKLYQHCLFLNWEDGSLMQEAGEGLIYIITQRATAYTSISQLCSDLATSRMVTGYCCAYIGDEVFVPVYEAKRGTGNYQNVLTLQGTDVSNNLPVTTFEIDDISGVVVNDTVTEL